jgi:Flp pilus assembly protein TadD
MIISMPPLRDLEPYLTAAGTLLSVATLGFVLNLAKLMSDAAKARAEVLEERVKKSEEDLGRTEKWSEREKARLQQEVDQLREQLSGAGVTTSLEAKEVAAHLSKEVKLAIESQLGELRTLLAKQQKNGDDIDHSAALQLGRGYMATEQWYLAGVFLQKYLSDNPNDWETQFAKGVAYANSRKGHESDLAALRSYNEAIAFGMETASGLDRLHRARLFIYRGAILKRLGRLDEAERDIELGKEVASDDYEKADATYNLACIYAMRGDAKRLLAILHEARALTQHAYVHRCILGHLGDYFSKFSKDGVFLKALTDLN